ncbi:succinyl-diaminopimelate desuccinylase [Rhodoferax sp.]|uniref:succinyl-diaminopimelate desuccinylase n=1 Tax=Rhodoferax sp. TaxID=50421 RepID=UPI0025F5B99D|nr:succinyl-diaminopimelate desuccinylase [Rhodoferax sp.]MCM2341645.1 succinyl-diaminopimelate desuccinylase [Rhodoferax sp.]
MNPTLALACDLIACPSETPSDAHCQQIMGARLQAIGFQLETVVSGPADFEVTNLWAKRPVRPIPGQPGATRLLVFAGHTDVVPTGPVKLWDSDPFKPTQRDGKLFGRGAADMKTSLAAFVVATEEFLAAQPDTPLTIGFLLTSDEEGPALDGTVKVCDMLQARGEVLDYCIVGEPTSVKSTGDMIKNGRRGSLNGKLTVKGTQGHIAYPQLANNPIHLLAPALAELTGIDWDRGNAFFPPTSWQVSNIHGGTGASNVIPGTVVVDFNFRFSTESTPEILQSRLQAVLDRHDFAYDLAWTLSGLPFLTPPGTLVDTVVAAIGAETGLTPELSTSGGTSDGRFIAKICPQVIEFGPPNATIHKINEHIALADIEPLKNIYRRVLENLHAQLLA